MEYEILAVLKICLLFLLSARRLKRVFNFQLLSRIATFETFCAVSESRPVLRDTQLSIAGIFELMTVKAARVSGLT